MEARKGWIIWGNDRMRQIPFLFENPEMAMVFLIVRHPGVTFGGPDTEGSYGFWFDPAEADLDIDGSLIDGLICKVER